MEMNNRITALRELIKVAGSKAQDSLVNLQISQVILKKGQNLSMRFCLTQNLAKKNNATFASNTKKQNPFLNPDPNLLITELGDTHNLLFNKFNIFQDHLLVVTKKFQLQQNPLTVEDLNHSVSVLKALNGVLFFNGGKFSGASQSHKHLQLLPYDARSLPIFQQIHRFAQKKREEDQSISKQMAILKFPHFTFRHGIIVLQKNQNYQQLGVRLYEAYIKLYQFLKVMNKATNQKRDYNLIACQDFIAIFLRKKQHAFDKLSVNSVGYLGSVLFKDKEIFEEYLSNENITPLSILTDISLTQNQIKNEQQN